MTAFSHKTLHREDYAGKDMSKCI